MAPATTTLAIDVVLHGGTMITVTDEATTAALAVWWPGRESHPSFRARMQATLEAALPHLTDAGEPLASTADDVRAAGAAYQRGVEAGRAEQVTSTLEVTSGPTDYEVWRDALLIAAQTVEVKGDTDEVVYVARKLVGTLRRAGGRIDDDPADDFAPDDVLSFTEPDEDEDGEEDCPNCGSDDDEHEEGCPKEAGPF